MKGGAGVDDPCESCTPLHRNNQYVWQKKRKGKVAVSRKMYMLESVARDNGGKEVIEDRERSIGPR